MKVKLQNKASFIFKINKVHTKIYISFCAHISLKINMSLIQTTCAPQRTRNTPFPGAPQSLETCAIAHRPTQHSSISGSEPGMAYICPQGERDIYLINTNQKSLEV
jgi:hypothetical protein